MHIICQWSEEKRDNKYDAHQMLKRIKKYVKHMKMYYALYKDSQSLSDRILSEGRCIPGKTWWRTEEHVE